MKKILVILILFNYAINCFGLALPSEFRSNRFKVLISKYNEKIENKDNIVEKHFLNQVIENLVFMSLNFIKTKTLITKAILPRFKNIDYDNDIQYLPKTKRHLIHLFFDKNKQFTRRLGLADGKYLYAVDKDGRFYLLNSLDCAELGLESLFHSVILSGEPVGCAGEVIIKDHQIVKIDNNSGHYQPHPNNLLQIVFLLLKESVNFARAEETYVNFITKGGIYISHRNGYVYIRANDYISVLDTNDYWMLNKNLLNAA